MFDMGPCHCCVVLVCFGDGGVKQQVDAKAFVYVGPCFTCLYIHILYNIYIYVYITSLIGDCLCC